MDANKSWLPSAKYGLGSEKEFLNNPLVQERVMEDFLATMDALRTGKKRLADLPDDVVERFTTIRSARARLVCDIALDSRALVSVIRRSSPPLRCHTAPRRAHAALDVVPLEYLAEVVAGVLTIWRVPVGVCLLGKMLT